MRAEHRVVIVRMIVIVPLLLLSSTALAHEVGLSRATYALSGDSPGAELQLAQGELIAALPELDTDGDEALSVAELEAGKARVEALVVVPLTSTRGGEPCASELRGLAPVKGEDGTLDGVRLDVAFVCAAEGRAWTVDAGFLPALAHGHRHLVRIEAGGDPLSRVLYASSSQLEVTAAAPAAGAPADEDTQAHASGTSFWGMVVIGVEHIVFGWDHLVFLFGLILIGGRLRSLLGIITAFTIAHSVTLGISALGIWTPSGGIIEPLIALSIAYIGFENFFVKEIDGRWKLTVLFGLIHGFGFAGALAEVGLAQESVASTLFAFNLGVELGQIALVLPAIWLFNHLREHNWYASYAVRTMSAAIVVVGMYWFVERVI